MPSLPAEEKTSKQGSVLKVLGLLSRKDVAFGMLSTMLFFMGQFALFTYLRPFLETVTGVHTEQLSLVLLVMGVCGLGGTFIIGPLIHKSLFGILVGIPFLMMITALAFIIFGQSLAAVFILAGLWGLFGTSAPVAWWAWLSQTLHDEAEAGGGLMVAVIQLAITLGAAFGGWVYDAFGYEATFRMAGMILVAASVTAGLTWQLENRKASTLLNPDKF